MKTYGIPKPDSQMYYKFHSKVVWIKEWSDPDAVVEPVDQDPAHLIIIKRVNLRTVVPEHVLTNGQSTIEAQVEQVFIEIRNLNSARRLHGWCKEVEKSKDGGEMTFFYIGIKKMGVPASQSKLDKNQREVARDSGIDYDKHFHNLALDEHSNQDKSFCFIPDKLLEPFALPIMLRYAKPVVKMPPS
ncbi:hypothetical protein APHAL10511_000649 [Amanita phalloides]|nr:hypothetical protein APHAL10511_000649 [Amanita phalloides]